MTCPPHWQGSPQSERKCLHENLWEHQSKRFDIQANRITLVEQSVLRMQGMAHYHTAMINNRISHNEEQVQELKSEHREIYKQALRIFLAVGAAGGVVIFNFIWTNATGAGP